MREARRDAAGHAQPAPARTVESHHANLNGLPLHGLLQRGQCLRDGDAQHALALKPFAQLGAPGQVADLGEVAPVDRERGQALSAAVPGQGIEESIGRRVAGLSGVAEDARQRREHHEEVKRPPGRLRVQVPRPAHLRRQHAVDAVVVEGDEQGVFQHHCGVHDAAQGRQCVVDLGEHSGQRVGL
jgi:hypothetical protein